MKNFLRIVLVLMIIMVYTVYKVQKVHYKTEAVSKALKRAESQKVINRQNSQETAVIEIKNKKE